METAKEICPTTTMRKVNEGALLIDVRETDEVNTLSFDVPNIINIPLSEFEARFREIPKDKEIVMVCKVGAKSLKATYFLMNHGYKNVVNMQHGIARWVQKGFPTKGDTSAATSNVSCCSNSGCC
ncbi:MAG: rhodanese-like domain-containing protein [Flavobacteriaceae bacterium]|nr:rhodanese-like domain-containing protein [Flavobacteriaceae bacterium]